MADWPSEDELKQVLNIDSDNWDTTLDRVRSAAIAKVKRDVGLWDEMVDEPDDMLAQASLRMAEMISERPTTPIVHLANDPAYQTLLSGHRRSFGIG
jgi:hypothetical protein